MHISVNGFIKSFHLEFKNSKHVEVQLQFSHIFIRIIHNSIQRHLPRINPKIKAKDQDYSHFNGTKQD